MIRFDFGFVTRNSSFDWIIKPIDAELFNQSFNILDLDASIDQHQFILYLLRFVDIEHKM